MLFTGRYFGLREREREKQRVVVGFCVSHSCGGFEKWGYLYCEAYRGGLSVQVGHSYYVANFGACRRVTSKMNVRLAKEKHG